jgi:hypothetical protein
MAHPVYVLCSKSGSHDSETGFFSLFELIEKITIAPLPVPKPPVQITVVQAQPMMIVATWMIEPEAGEKIGEEYEHEFRFHLPGKPPIKPGVNHFKFAESMVFQRFVMRLDGPLPLEGAGTMWIESGVRTTDKGETGWRIQRYPVVIEEVGHTPAAPATNER